MNNMNKYCCDSKSKQMSKIEIILFICLYVNLLLTGILPQNFISIVLLVISIIITFLNKPHLIFPTLIFYYTNLGMVFGISTFRIYTFVFILYLIIKNKKMIMLDRKYAIVFFIYFLYCTIAVMKFDFQIGLFALFDVVFIMLLSKQFLMKDENLRSFFKHYVIVTVISFVTGVVTHNILDVSMETGTTYIDIERYMATFNDPNYMGFFFTTAVFALVCLKLFNKYLRIILILTIYVMLFSTVSMTAIIVNVILWLLYILFKQNKKIYQIIIVVFCIFSVLNLYNYALKNDLGFVSTTAIRIEEKIKMFNQKDIDGFTTGRTSLTEKHWEYYIQQSTVKIFLGGNLSNGHILDLPPNINFVAHNEYVDLLLNVGIIGTVLLLFHPISLLIKYYSLYIKTKNQTYLMKTFIKAIWLLYAVTLTLFLDMRFFLFFIL